MEASVTIKRSWMFGDLKPGMTASLGPTPSDIYVHAAIERREDDGGWRFWVINGAWHGSLYEQHVTYENGEECNVLYIVDERGERHEPVYIIDVKEPKKPVPVEDDDEVPY